ncbi:MAG: EutN/CcmL family microcompartment protein [Planctomycetota bacterium]
MKLARVVGTVTLSRKNESMNACRLRAVEVVPSASQIEAEPLGGDTIVAWDLCGAADGDLVALAEGPEAAAPFRPDLIPIDASIVALLDSYSLTAPDGMPTSI